MASATKEYSDVEIIFRLSESEARTIRDMLAITSSSDDKEMSDIASMINALNSVGIRFRVGNPGTTHLNFQR